MTIKAPFCWFNCALWVITNKTLVILSSHADRHASSGTETPTWFWAGEKFTDHLSFPDTWQQTMETQIRHQHMNDSTRSVIHTTVCSLNQQGKCGESEHDADTSLQQRRQKHLSQRLCYELLQEIKTLTTWGFFF